MVEPHASVPLIDVGQGGAVAHAACRSAQALAVRDAGLGFLPLGPLLARVADPIVRHWMRRSGSPYVHEIEAIAKSVGRPGVWLLHGAYLFGCTAMAEETPAGPRLVRTLDWPFAGLGRLVEVVRQSGPTGPFLNVTWPGFAGVLTASAPGRFAAAINQAPMRYRTGNAWLVWIDYVLNAVNPLLLTGHPPPEHVLRMAFDTCRTFGEARQLLETAPVARPVLFTLVGPNAGEHVVIERQGDRVRTYSDETVVANAWREEIDGWRPRVCGVGTPRENNRRRIEALSRWQGRSDNGFAWAEPPVINDYTRLTVEMCPAAGTLSVMGWEPDGRGGAIPATSATTFSCRTADLQVRS
jgi:hypothetical protein